MIVNKQHYNHNITLQNNCKTNYVVRLQKRVLYHRRRALFVLCNSALGRRKLIMSRRIPVRPRVKVTNPVFHLQDKKADDSILTHGLIKSAKRTGQLCLCGKGLGTVPENVWNIDELVLEETKEVDFNRSDSDGWWNALPLKMLDLSSNAIKEIPPKVKQLIDLVTLKLHDNALTELPPEIGELKELANLSLDHNKLSKLPKEFYQLVELRTLSISHNLLRKLEPDIGDLVMLTFLDLSYNQLKSLPPGMGYLVRLVELDLSFNQIAELPPDIVNLRELKKLRVNQNELKSLPPLGELRKMESLDANHNNIVTIPDFYGCHALRELLLGNNLIEEITEEFCDQAQYLNVLIVRDNKIKQLPENIALLKSLKRLDFSNNELDQLPKNLGLLSQLNSICMDGNKLSAVRSDVLRGGSERVLRFLRDRITDEAAQETKDDGCGWPDKYTLKKSQALVLKARELDQVPDDVFIAAADAEVHIADLSKNKLNSVPLGVCRIAETLCQLVLSANNIVCVPGEVGRCRNLQFLDLSKNLVSDLPPELGELKHLRELVISNNRFTRLPQCIYDMENLEILLAAENKVEEIDLSAHALPRLKRLAVLDLTNNSIRTVPPELGNFQHLRSLELMGNLFRQPRHAILAKGTASLLSYLRDRIPKH